MIPTAKAIAKSRKTVAALALVASLASCTSSKLIIGPLYNQLDNKMRSEFSELADFSDEQLTAFDQAVGTFHVWHRQSELPAYSELLLDISEKIEQKDYATINDVERWAQQIESYSEQARECHPINYLLDMAKTLNAEQIDSIQQHFEQERAENRERYAERTPEERLQRRLDNIIKWAGRINFNFTEKQKLILKEALEQQISLRKEYYELSDTWNAEFFVLLRQADSPSYQEDLRNHLRQLWDLLETHYPEQWAHNRQLWRKTAFRLIESMSTGQRNSASKWLSKMAGTVKAISQDTPSFKVEDNPRFGCHPKTSI